MTAPVGDGATTSNDGPASPDGAAGEADYGQFPLRTFLGMELTGDAPGIGHATVDVGPEHLNPNGVVHGAVLFALVDTAMGKATMSVVDEPGRYCASVEVSLRFIRPAVSGRVTAEARVVKRGRHLAHLDADVHDVDGRLVATSTGTFALLGG